MPRRLTGALHSVVIQVIVDEFAFPPGMHQVCLSQDSKVLGSNGLLDVKRCVNFIDAGRILVVDDAANLDTERMSQCPEDIGRRTQMAAVLKTGRGRGKFIHAGGG